MAMFRPFYQRSIQQRLRQHIDTVGGASYANERLKKMSSMYSSGDWGGLLEEGYISESQYREIRRIESEKERKEDERIMNQLAAQHQAALEQAEQEWFSNTSPKAKRRDLKSLEKALAGGAYGNASREEEAQHQQNYVNNILEKYGEDTEVLRILQKYDWDVEYEDEEDSEITYEEPKTTAKERPSKQSKLETDVNDAAIIERAKGLKQYWESEGVDLSDDEWIEAAARVEDGESVRDVLGSYGFAEEYDNYAETDYEDEDDDYEDEDDDYEDEDDDYEDEDDD